MRYYQLKTAKNTDSTGIVYQCITIQWITKGKYIIIAKGKYYYEEFAKGK